MNNKKFKYKLPNESGEAEEVITSNNSLIIIGANGSGKSRLGVWLEQNDLQDTHRAGAQRSLSFGEYIKLKSQEQAENLLQYGTDRESHNHDNRWGWDGEKYNYTTSLLNDYEHILSVLIAKKNNQHDTFIKECKEKEVQSQQHNNVPETVIDTLNPNLSHLYVIGNIYGSFSCTY